MLQAFAADSVASQLAPPYGRGSEPFLGNSCGLSGKQRQKTPAIGAHSSNSNSNNHNNQHDT